MALQPPGLVGCDGWKPFAASTISFSLSMTFRLAAVGQIDEAAVLARVASTDSHWEVRHAAVSKLNDQRALATVAPADSHAEVRYAAVMRLCDPSALERIASEDSSRDLRELAALRLARGSVAGGSRPTSSVQRRKARRWD